MSPPILPSQPAPTEPDIDDNGLDRSQIRAMLALAPEPEDRLRWIEGRHLRRRGLLRADEDGADPEVPGDPESTLAARRRRVRRHPPARSG